MKETKSQDSELQKRLILEDIIEEKLPENVIFKLSPKRGEGTMWRTKGRVLHEEE